MKFVIPHSLVFAAALALGAQAYGRIFTITNPTDSTRITSLRGAIINANQHPGNTTIILPGRVYRLTLQGTVEDRALTGDLDITRGNLTIVGTGRGVTIDATGLGDRVFQVFTNASLTLINLTITGGSSSIDGQYGQWDYLHLDDGGAVLNSGTLTMDDCIISGNSSSDGGGGYYNNGSDGGGIFNRGVALLNHCNINTNSAGSGLYPNPFGLGGNGGSGGGIYNSGTMTLNKCRISANHSGQGSYGALFGNSVVAPGAPAGAGGNGAGICNAGQMNLNDCTVSDNSCGNGGDGCSSTYSGGSGGAGGSGAGIFNVGTLSVKTCTISDNHCGIGGNGGNGGMAVYSEYNENGVGGCGGGGGGIYNAGSLDLVSCTITLNEAALGGDSGHGLYAPAIPAGQDGNGGGILNDTNSTEVTVRNTLASHNWVSAGVLVGPGPDLAGDFTSQGFNLIGIADGSTGFVNGVNSDLAGSIATPVDPLIGPLQDNGGPTPTHALLPGSPAIDQGNSFGLQLDQRGYSRPYNDPAASNAAGGDGSDIGAFEFGSSLRHSRR